MVMQMYSLQASKGLVLSERRYFGRNGKQFDLIYHWNYRNTEEWVKVKFEKSDGIRNELEKVHCNKLD